MAKTSDVQTSQQEMMNTLSELLLCDDVSLQRPALVSALRSVDRAQFDALLVMSQRNHVVIRGMGLFRDLMLAGHDEERAKWAAAALAEENARILNATGFLRIICDAFEEEKLDLTVIKSLDHWPDFGSDIDLYTNTPAQTVCSLMQRKFGAKVEPRSWGDRLASKWNFEIPGLADPVEVHTGRLGQTGEHLLLAARIPERARLLEFGGQSFWVASVSDRIMISTLQRMYRHFYFRLCDILDSASLANSGVIDYDELRRSAQDAGIWDGVATYLVLVSDYVQKYRGFGLELPSFVRDMARFGGNVMHVGGGFLRVPIMPQAVGLYRSQLNGLVKRRELESSARLGLLPMLATAAAIGYKITGSDKGIW
jgi:hypothetical protein